jgi:hypothetical protein
MNKHNKVIVLDANIILRAVFGINTFDLINNNKEKSIFCTPSYCYDEVIFHLPNIARKR